MTRPWTPARLEALGIAAEIEIAAATPDSALGPFAAAWVLRIGDQIYVRSWQRDNAPWFRRLTSSRRGTVGAGALLVDVVADHVGRGDPAPLDSPLRAVLDDGYRRKYNRLGGPYVAAAIRDIAAATAIRLTPGR